MRCRRRWMIRNLMKTMRTREPTLIAARAASRGFSVSHYLRNRTAVDCHRMNEVLSNKYRLYFTASNLICIIAQIGPALRFLPQAV